MIGTEQTLAPLAANRASVDAITAGRAGANLGSGEAATTARGLPYAVAGSGPAALDSALGLASGVARADSVQLGVRDAGNTDPSGSLMRTLGDVGPQGASPQSSVNADVGAAALLVNSSDSRSLNPLASALRLPVGNNTGVLAEQQFAQDIGDRLQWLSQQGRHFAQLNMHPSRLGPVEVHIAVNEAEANVHFVATHAQTREALESALPRLREQLEAGGLMLGEASVGSERFEHSQDPDHESSGEAKAQLSDSVMTESDLADDPERLARATSSRLLDRFA